MPTRSEAESKRLLAAFGVPVVADRLVADPEEAAAAAAEFGGPVVVKLCGAAIAHRTERGLVRLGVEGAAVRQAAAEPRLRVHPGGCQPRTAQGMRGQGRPRRLRLHRRLRRSGGGGPSGPGRGPFYPGHGLDRIVAYHERQERRYAQTAAALAGATGKPVLAATELAMGDAVNPAVAGVRESGKLCYPSANRAVTALAHLWRHARWRRRLGL